MFSASEKFLNGNPTSLIWFVFSCNKMSSTTGVLLSDFPVITICLLWVTMPFLGSISIGAEDP